MLVLSRKAGQKIVIGSEIEILVTEVRGNSVRLGIKAPPDVAVHREEVHRRIKAEAFSEVHCIEIRDHNQPPCALAAV